MYRALSLLVVLLVACALAAPTPRSLSKRTFKLASRGRPTHHRNPAEEMARAYKKFGWEIIIVNPGPSGSTTTLDLPGPSGTVTLAPVSSAAETAPASSAVETTPASSSSAPASSAVVAAPTNSSNSSTASPTASGDQGEVQASPEANDSEYLEKVTIGGQQLVMDFDTGSSDLWVFSTDLPSNEIGSHTTFNPSKSSTFKNLEGASFMISYGDGSSAAGTVGYDVVNIGGATATKQAVEIATTVSGSFVTDTANDGLVGLGFSNINTVQPQQQKTFFANIMDQLEQPLFTADLEAGASGMYEFGSIDNSKYTGSLTFTPVDSTNGFWQFDSTSFAIGGKTTQNANGSPAIADTGTSLLLVDSNVATAYYDQVQGAELNEEAGGYVYPCSTTLPDFAVAVGDYMATVKGADLTFAQVDSEDCFGGVQSNGGGDIQIYGDVLLKSQFVVFNGGNMTIGMAPKA